MIVPSRCPCNMVCTPPASPTPVLAGLLPRLAPPCGRWSCSLHRRSKNLGTATSASSSSQDGSSNSAEAPVSLLQRWRVAAQEQANKLKDWGLAGVVAYGALNTLYYSIAFVACWVYIADVPKGQGLAAAARAFLTVFATVWAGSQVTKLARAGLALAMAPFVDKALDMSVARFGMKSKRQAFLAFLGICITLALTIFGVVVMAWQ